jgi:hypothetical protein
MHIEEIRAYGKKLARTERLGGDAHLCGPAPWRQRDKASDCVIIDPGKHIGGSGPGIDVVQQCGRISVYTTIGRGGNLV